MSANEASNGATKRLGILLGAFISGLDSSATLELPTELLPLKQLCSARNYLYLCRFKLQDNPVIFVQALHRLITFMPNFLNELEELALQGSAPVYNLLGPVLDLRIQEFVTKHLTRIKDYVGIPYINYIRVFSYNRKPYSVFMEEAPIPKKLLPYGVYLDSLVGMMKRYSLMLQCDNLLLWHLAHADLLLGDSSTPICENLKDTSEYEIYVDADNVLFTTAYATLSQLAQDSRISQITIFTDTGSSLLWQILSNYRKVTLQSVPRVIRDKSLVDLTIVSQLTRNTLEHKTKPILFSGDSDYCVLNGLQDLLVIYTPDRQNMNNTYLGDLSARGIRALPCITPTPDADSSLYTEIAALLLKFEREGHAVPLSQACARRDLHHINQARVNEMISKGRI